MLAAGSVAVEVGGGGAAVRHHLATLGDGVEVAVCVFRFRFRLDRCHLHDGRWGWQGWR